MAGVPRQVGPQPLGVGGVRQVVGRRLQHRVLQLLLLGERHDAERRHAQQRRHVRLRLPARARAWGVTVQYVTEQVMIRKVSSRSQVR